MRTALPAVYRKARLHLSRRDPTLKRLIASIGPCTLQPDRQRFAALVRAIIAQQISTKAARAIHVRLAEALSAAGITPAGVLAASDATLRAAGLSASKVRAISDLAQKIEDGIVLLQSLHRLPDEEVIQRLLPVHGIGRWTAEMFLIFSLGRLDVLPVGDWGLRLGVQRHYELEVPPAKDVLETLAEPWRPYRSVATWYFWRSFGNVPQSR